MTKKTKAERKAARQERWANNRLNQGNTPKFWAKIRDIAGTVFVVTGAIATTIATGGIAAPAWVLTTLTITSGVSGLLSGRAATKKEKPEQKK